MFVSPLAYDCFALELAVVCIEPRRQWLANTLAKYGIDVDFEQLTIEDKLFNEGEFDEEAYLKSLDPREWKKQDHYAVLGLRNKRIRATEDEIRRACKW